MGSNKGYSFRCAIAVMLMVLSTSSYCSAQLSSNFYANSCPKALFTIRNSILNAVFREPRMAASLIRLHFLDCFVQGCDASVLLNDSATIDSEQNAIQNLNSARGFEVIEEAKSRVESLCPETVSCADILSVAARDASVAVGGPSWTVKLGRRDSTTANRALALATLPSFNASLDSLISLFGSKGLSVRDMVALSGAHSIGQAQCVTFRDRIYNSSSDINSIFRLILKLRCPSDQSQGNTNLAALDSGTPNYLDNNYFKNLIQKRGLLESDQILFSGGSTDSIVNEYSQSILTFRADFTAAMIRMGDIEPLIGSAGEIRRTCSFIN